MDGEHLANNRRIHSYTSESTTEGHPDKLADQISDAILDEIIAKDPFARVACEVCVATGLVLVLGQITTDCYVDIPTVVRKCIKDAGYTRAKYGFDADTCGIMVSIDEQSPDISRGVDIGGAGDSSIVYGFACNETPELMPLPIMIAHRLARRLAQVRKTREIPYLRPDGKCQVTIEYEGDSAVRVSDIVISAQHHEELNKEQLEEDIIREVVAKSVPPELLHDSTRILINPTGRFVVGGPVADTGMTGRKSAVDTYGGCARHGGGSFSGKDPTKVDRSGAYAARYLAKNIVASGLADKCEIQIVYAIGIVKPIRVEIETFGTEKVDRDFLLKLIDRHFDLSPLGIIKQLNLRRPIYRPTACYGHFGRTDIDVPWEKTDLATIFAEEAGL